MKKIYKIILEHGWNDNSQNDPQTKIVGFFTSKSLAMLAASKLVDTKRSEAIQELEESIKTNQSYDAKETLEYLITKLATHKVHYNDLVERGYIDITYLDDRNVDWTIIRMIEYDLLENIDDCHFEES